MKPRIRRLLEAHPGAAVALAASLCAGLVVLIGSATQLRSERRAESIGRAMTGGDPARAEAIVRRFGCGGCHTISALPGADGQVAAPLDHLRQRVFIGGVVRNTPDNLVQWIVSPQSLSPRSAMPATGIDERQARDVAAYLYSH